MAAFNHEGSNKDNNMMKAKSEETDSRNQNASFIKRWKLKASSAEKGTRYQCKECGKHTIKKQLGQLSIFELTQEQFFGRTDRQANGWTNYNL